MASTTVVAVQEFREQLEARTSEFANALPSHIRPERFQRAALTALAQNPKLLNVDRRSLFNALMRCAQDGLEPDGRQAALVIYKDRERGEIAQYQQMVQGVRLLVQQGGEITRFEQTVVHQNDVFNYQLGDDPRILHVPNIEDPGPPILVYSVAQFRERLGERPTLSRDVMTFAEIEKVRGVSRSKDGPAWTDWWEEMAKKTIAKRHAKVLPTSGEAKAALARDDAEHVDLSRSVSRALTSGPASRPRLVEQLDAVSQDTPSAEPQRRRGRPRSTKDDSSPPLDDVPVHDHVPDTVPGSGHQLDLSDVQGEAAVEVDAWPGPRPDFDRGVKDAEAGRAGCLDREIRDAPERMAEWQAGFDSKKNKRLKV